MSNPKFSIEVVTGKVIFKSCFGYPNVTIEEESPFEWLAGFVPTLIQNPFKMFGTKYEIINTDNGFEVLINDLKVLSWLEDNVWFVQNDNKDDFTKRELDVIMIHKMYQSIIPNEKAKEPVNTWKVLEVSK